MVLCKHEPLAAQLSGLSGSVLIERMNQKVSELNAGRAKIQRRFDGWRTIQYAIARDHGALEFRRSGSLRYNLFESSFAAEKAVDVKLATDLIMLRDIYDTAVIVSGDQDYVPAVQAVKDSGKLVANVGFLTRSQKLLPGGAWRLNMAVDWNVDVPYEVFREHSRLDAVPATAGVDPAAPPSAESDDGPSGPQNPAR